MAAEDILGISGQMDISDIQQSFDKLINDLNSLGVKTDEVSSKMTKALNDIAQSSASDSEKTKQSMQTLKQGIEEINKSLTDTPEALKKLASEAQTAEATVGKLKKKLSETTEDPQKWNEINEQLKTQQNLVTKLNGEYSSMLGTFGSTQQYVGTLNAAIDTLNAGRSISTAATGASAVAHVGAAAAVGSEAVAHGENSTKIADETQKVQENVTAVQQAIEASKQRVASINEVAEATKRVAERLQEGKASEEEYLRTKEEAEQRISELSKQSIELEERRKQAYDRMQDAFNKGIGADGKTKASADSEHHMYTDLNNALAKQRDDTDNQIRTIQESLNSLNDAYKSLNNTQQQQAQSATQSHAQEAEQTSKETEAIKAKEEEIKNLKSYLEALDEQRGRLENEGLLTKLVYGTKMYGAPWGDHQGGEYGKTKQQIADAEAALSKLKQTASEVKNETTDMWAGMTKEDIAGVIREDVEQLKILKSTFQDISVTKGKNSEEAKKNKEQQKRITEEILSGKNKLKEMGVAYEDVVKEAKKTKEETKNIGKEAEDASKKIGGVFSKMKNALGGAMKGDFSGLFSVFGKFVGWSAALGAIGKGLYELTQRAEEFKQALLPLSHYIDENRLETVRQDILALSGSTAKSVSDMASAATQFVKVWDSLRESPEALITMVKSANEFGALAGKTSEESAKYLANLASEYHMTAQEATEASAMIATAAHGSTSTFGEMAEALKSAGSTASIYGVSFKDMATLIGYSANNFGGAQKAASKFSMLLMNMENQQNSKFKPSVVGMVQALQNMKVAMDNGEVSQETFGSRIRQTAKYFINNAEAIAEYGKHIDSNKAKQEGLADVNARATTNVAKLQNAWNGFLTSLNANYTPILTKILNFFNQIIGGAQKSAKQLNYIKNFDKIHSGAKQGMQYTKSVTSTSGWSAGSPESAVANMGARQQYNLSMEEGWKQYQKQEAYLAAKFRNIYKVFRNKWKNASEDAILNAAQNSVVRHYENNKDKYSEFNSETFNSWLREQRDTAKALNRKTNNSDNGGNGNFKAEPDKNAQKLAEQQRQYREQQAEQQAKQLAEDKKLEWDLYIAEQEEGIAKEHDANEKELKQRNLDFEKKKHQIEEEAEQLRQKNIAAAKATYDKNPANKKKEGFYASGLDKGIKLTDDQQKLIDSKNRLINAQIDANNKAFIQNQLQNLYNYLKEYGNFEAQKLAITEEYAEKIKKAQESGNDIEVMRLQSEQKKQLNKVDTDSLLDRANLATVFQDFGLIMRKPLEQTLDALQKFTQSSDFKKRSMDEQKTVYEAINKANNALGNFDNTSIKDLGMQVADYNNALTEQVIAQRELAEATRDYVAAEKELLNAKLSNNESTIKEAQATYDDAKAKLTSAQVNSDNANSQVISSQIKVNKGMSQFNNMLNKVSTSINSLKNGGLKAIWDLLGNKIQSNIGNFIAGSASFEKELSKMGEELSKKGIKINEFSGQISDTITSITSDIGESLNKDELKKQLQEGVTSLFQSTFGDGENFKTIQKSVGSFVGNLIDSATSASDAKDKVADAVGNIIDKVANAGQASGNLWGMIIGLVLQLLDELADNGLADLVKQLLERIGDAIEGLLKNLFAELIPAIIEGVVNAIGSIGEGLLGLFGIDTSGWFSNEKEITENRERLIAEAEKLTKSIEGLKDELSKQSGIKAIDTANELVELQKQKIENARQQLINENEYYSAHHSNASYWSENALEVYDHGSWAEITKALQEYKKKNANAETVTDSAHSYEDLLKLTPEQLDYIRTHYANQWQAIKNVGKYDQSDEKWEALADMAGDLEETLTTLNESLTQTTFDSLKDNFISTLMDMDASAADFSDKFSEYLQQAVISAQVSNLLEDDMQKFYKDWAARAKANGGTLTTNDVDELKKQWDDLVQQGLTIRDQVASITGYTGSQSEQTATGKAIEAITEDQASSLIGIGYAMQIALEQGNEVRNAISVDVSSLRLYAEQNANNLSEMRDIQYQGLEQLEAINKNTAPIILIREDIASMYKLMKDKY